MKTGAGTRRRLLLCRKIQKIMNTALFVWCLIAGMTLGACLTALVMKIGARHAAAAHVHVPRRHARRRFVSVGTEREEFFVPGDPLEKDDDYDDDDL